MTWHNVIFLLCPACGPKFDDNVWPLRAPRVTLSAAAAFWAFHSHPRCALTSGKRCVLSPGNYISVLLLTCHSCDQRHVWTRFVHLSHYCESDISGGSQVWPLFKLYVRLESWSDAAWIRNTNLGCPPWNQGDCTDLLRKSHWSYNFLQEPLPLPLEKVCVTYIIDRYSIYHRGKQLDGCMEAHSYGAVVQVFSKTWTPVRWCCREVHPRFQSKVWEWF